MNSILQRRYSQSLIKRRSEQAEKREGSRMSANKVHIKAVIDFDQATTEFYLVPESVELAAGRVCCQRLVDHTRPSDRLEGVYLGHCRRLAGATQVYLVCRGVITDERVYVCYQHAEEILAMKEHDMTTPLEWYDCMEKGM